MSVSSDIPSIDYDTLENVGMVHISVKDSGVGMTEDNLSNLFQEGVQFNANQLQGGKGSGLGLWVSKGFAQRHNGDIVAESAGEGQGCTFTLQLPAYKRTALPGGQVDKYATISISDIDVETGGGNVIRKRNHNLSAIDLDDDQKEEEYLSLSTMAKPPVSPVAREFAPATGFKVS